MIPLPLFQPPPEPPPPPPPAPAQTAKPAGRVHYYNPVFGRRFPDPMVLRVGRHYYAYGTTVTRRHVFPVMRSRDLIHWREVGDAFLRPPRWSFAHWWAPSATRRGGTFHLFYSAKRRRPRRHCVAVATARRPAGPFEHRRVLVCGRGAGYIDPAPFRDRDGTTWLYFSRTDRRCGRAPRRCFIAAMPLRRDLLAPAGRPRRVLNVSMSWERAGDYAAVENPWMVRRGGTYYLLYSGNWWQGDYGMGYAIGPSPLGPFTKTEPSPFLAGRQGVRGPGGGSVITGPGGGLWLVYHARRTGVGYANDGRRSLHVDPLVVGGGKVDVHGPSVESRVKP